MFKITQPVFAAVRLDESATEVIRQSVDLAQHYNVKLYVCHVLHDMASVRPLFPQLQLESAMKLAELEGTARGALSSRVAAFVNLQAGNCELLIEYGTAHSAILRAAERVGAGLIVVGHGSQEHSLSGTSERVVRHAHCPVLVARPNRKGCVLAATDFSDPANPAIDAAASEAARRGLELNLIHAIDLVPYFVVSDGMVPATLSADFSKEMYQTMQTRLDECAARVSAKKGILVTGSADTEILSASVNLPADLVVVGTHGRSGLTRLALGSVAEAVVRGARCSILVVRLHG
jgi:nucleotide-binding universal stress UspA family protein